MGWRFRKSIRLGKGVRLNLSKSGVGMSVGGKGFRVGVNKKGIYTSTSIPGTGLYRMDYLHKNKKRKNSEASTLLTKASDPLPTPPELLTGMEKSCLWTIISIILLIWQPLLGITSLILQGIYHYKKSKTPERRALKHFNLGKGAYQKEDYETALKHFLQVVELVPHIQSLDLTIADLYLSLEDLPCAIIYLEKYLENNPQDLSAKIKLANALANTHEYKKALEILQSLPDDLRHELSIINAIAICFIKLNHFDLALKVLEKGPLQKRKMDEDMKLFRYLLGVCYKEMGDKTKAIKQLKRVYAEDISYLDVEKQLKQLEE